MTWRPRSYLRGMRAESLPAGETGGRVLAAGTAMSRLSRDVGDGAEEMTDAIPGARAGSGNR